MAFDAACIGFIQLAFLLAAEAPADIGPNDRPSRVFTGAEVNCVRFSPNGKLIAAGTNKFTRTESVRILDVKSGKLKMELKGNSEPIESVAFSPDGKVLASASNDQTVILWQMPSGKRIAILQAFKGDISDGEVNSVAFSPNGKILAAASGIGDAVIRLWDWRNRKVVKVLRCNNEAFQSVAFSPDGKILASGSYDHTVRLWDVGKGKEIAVLRGHSDIVRAVAFSVDGKLVASVSTNDGTVRIWNIASHKQVATLHAHEPFALAFSPDGHWLATGGRIEGEEKDKLYGNIDIWSLTTRKLVLRFKAHTFPTAIPIITLDFSPNGKTLAAGSCDGTVKLWNLGRLMRRR